MKSADIENLVGETPYYYVSPGERIAYVKMSNESVPAKAQTLKRLVMNGTHQTYDTLRTSYDPKDFSFQQLRAMYKDSTLSSWQDKYFLSYGLIDETGRLTNAGALLADNCPIRCSRVFCTHWAGKDKAAGLAEAIDDREITGSLINLLMGSMEFVRANTKKRWMKLIDNRVDMPEYPMRAVQECIINALIHRDYMELGSEVHIDIYSDRMEIYSPGGMMDGTRIQDLDIRSISSKRRNPVIADMFNRLDLMERRGSGFQKIVTYYENAALYRDNLKPKFYSSAGDFRVILYNLNYGVDEEQIEQIKENLLEKQKDEPADSESVSIAPKKVSIGAESVSIAPKKVSIGTESVSIAPKKVLVDKIGEIIKEKIREGKLHCETAHKIYLLYVTYKKNYFGRTDIMKTLNYSSPNMAGKMLRKLKQLDLIQPIKGKGKGKYIFKKLT